VEEADSIRIDCWNEEENIINEILPLVAVLIKKAANA